MNKKFLIVVSLILSTILSLAVIFLIQENRNLQLELMSISKTSETTKNYSQNKASDLPLGYTLEHYRVEKVSTSTCAHDSDCQTPGEYLMQSRCPFTSLCLNGRCAVICPDFEE